MKVSTRTRDDVTIVDLEGKITIGRGDVALRDAVNVAIDDGSRAVVLNFAGVKRMDSSGMAELGAAYRRMDDLGGTIALSNVPSNVAEILRMTQIVTVFDVYPSEDEALAEMG